MMDRRLRVLFLPAWYPSEQKPGEALFIREHARAVSRLHDVVVLHIVAGAANSISDRQEGPVRVIRCEFAIGRAARLLPGFLGALFRDWQQVAITNRLVGGLAREGWKPEIIHAHVYPAALGGLPLAKELRIPIVLTEHWTGFARRLIGKMGAVKARSIIGRMNAVMPVSRDLQKDMEGYGISAKFTVVPNAIDAVRFRPGAGARGDARGQPRILFIGGLDPRKGFEDLAGAACVLKDRGLRPFVIFAGSSDIGEARRVFGDLTRGEVDVEVHGRLSHDAVAAQMAKADCLVVASNCETFCCAAAEAIASGCPVAAYGIGPLPEVVEGDSGRLAKWSDDFGQRVGNLADCIEVIVRNRQAFDPVVMHRRAEERYGHSAVAAQIDSVYASVLRDNAVGE